MSRDIKQLISEMTVEEKAGLCSGKDFWNLKGIERLGIPSIMVTDGPHGLRKQQASSDHLGIFNSVPATCFPSAAGLASSWNKDLIQQLGIALGEECQSENVAVLLGPGTNIKRSPLCGRNFEYFSEDPYLSSQLATSHIIGVQSQGVGTSLKHFAANNQEHRRMTSDSIVDERTLREIYLASFEETVKEAQPWTVMCSYNKVNGDYASENNYLLTEILKKEWGHEGLVVSDWGAVNDRVLALAAGLELEMPSSGGVGDAKIVAAVKNGQLSMDILDDAVERILQVIFKSVDQKKENASYDKEEHHSLARSVAHESMVLLKNDNAILPLSTSSNIAVIGELAVKPRYQGGGSSHVNPTKMDNVIDEMLKLSALDATITYAQGYDLKEDEANTKLVAEALGVAKDAEIILLFVGLPEHYESEGFDRSHLNLPENQLHLINALTKQHQKVVVVLHNGAPVEMPWLTSVQAVLEVYLGGQSLGGAIADIIYGKVNPSGKLAETFPLRLEHNPSYLNFPGEGDVVEYKEGLFVGYRYYDTKKIDVLFPFGYGLSYTTFEYSNLSVSKTTMVDDENLDITLDVTNTGLYAGKEIVQLYVRDIESSVTRPLKELKGFIKVELQPNETKTVTFQLSKRAFAYYSTELIDWYVESGQFELLIGKSSQEIVLTETIHVHSSTPLKEVFHKNSTVGDVMSNASAAELVQQWLSKSPLAAMLSEQEGSGSEMVQAMMKYLPLRGIVGFSGGAITDASLDELLAQLNQK